MKFKRIVLFTVLLVSQAASAETYLKAKQYLDVKQGKMISPANILIEDGMIKAINPPSVPENVDVIEARNLTILPGLMDVHVHLPNDLYNGSQLQFAQNDDAMFSMIGVKNARKLLMAGFTTVRNLGLTPGESFVDVALSKASEAKWIDAPHIVPSGHPLSITGGHIDPDMFGSYAPNVLPVSYRTGVADGVDEVVKATRYQIKYGAKVIKVAATAGVLSDEPGVGNQQYSDEELKAIVDEADRHGIPVAVHAHGTAGIKASIRAGVKSVEHGSLLDDEAIRMMKEKGTFLVPTSYLADGMDLSKLTPTSRKKAEYILPQAKKSWEKAIKAGVKIAFGTDSGVYPHGENAKEFSSLVARGMTPLGAIQASTINAAELLNMKDRGEIKKGYHADLVGVSDDPLTNVKTLESVKFVMKDGTVYKNDQGHTPSS